MRAFDEKTMQDLRSRPLDRAEADDVYGLRRRVVVLSDLGLIALVAVCAVLGFAPWYAAVAVAALGLCLLPLTLFVFRWELEEQVRAAEEEVSSPRLAPRG